MTMAKLNLLKLKKKKKKTKLFEHYSRTIGKFVSAAYLIILHFIALFRCVY